MVFDLVKEPLDNLWEVTVDPQTGKPATGARQITNWGQLQVLHLNVSRDDHRLLVEKDHVRRDIYVGGLKEHGARMDALRRLTFDDSYHNNVFGWSLDCKALFFLSDRTGAEQIYQQKLDQDGAEPLASIPGELGDAVVSPDGSWILYWFKENGTNTSRLMRLPLPQGTPQQVLELPPGEVAHFDCPHGAGNHCVLYRSEKDQLTFYELDPLRGLGKELQRFSLKAQGIRGIARCDARRA